LPISFPFLSEKAIIIPMKKVKYGIDSLSLIWSLFIGSTVALALALFFFFYLRVSHPGAAIGLFWLALVAAVVMFAESILMILSSTKGKGKVLPLVIESLSLQGNEKILDMGCGRGQLLALLGKSVPDGSVVGVDSNHRERAISNIEHEGVSNVTVQLEDLNKLSFPDESFDAVTAALSLHNLPERMERERALIEISRVLKPGGRLAILDCHRINEYAETLKHLQWNDVIISNRQYRMFPFARIITASKPNVIIV
jgi:SAM-dependent methyltransferase